MTKNIVLKHSIDMMEEQPMEPEELRNEIMECLHQRETTEEKLRSYVYELYLKEGKQPNPTLGWKQMLRELGFVI